MAATIKQIGDLVRVSYATVSLVFIDTYHPSIDMDSDSSVHSVAKPRKRETLA
jgi:hypothetical protein